MLCVVLSSGFIPILTLVKRVDAKPRLLESRFFAKLALPKQVSPSMVNSTVDEGGNTFLHLMLGARSRRDAHITFFEALLLADAERLEKFDFESCNQEGKSVFELLQAEVSLPVHARQAKEDAASVGQWWYDSSHLPRLRRFVRRYEIIRLEKIEPVLTKYVIKDLAQMVMQVSKKERKQRVREAKKWQELG